MMSKHSKIFSCIFLVVTLMVSTVVISATEANAYSDADEGQSIVIDQDTASGDYDTASDPENEESAGLGPNDNNAAEETENGNEEITEDDNGSNEEDPAYTEPDDDFYGEPEDNYPPEENHTPDEDDTYREPDEGPTQETPDIEQEIPDEDDITEDDITEPSYTHFITILNYPSTVAPIGQSPTGTTSVQHGENIDLVAGTAWGYTFSHWSFSTSDPYDNFNFGINTDASTSFQINNTMTVTANWVASETEGSSNYVEITFNPNGGVWEDGYSGSRTYAFPIYEDTDTANSISMPEDPVRPGYAFIGWNTQPDGEGEWVCIDTMNILE